MKPRRIQLRRTKGWKLPPNTVKVDRSTRWGNPFRPEWATVGGVEEAVKTYRDWLYGMVVGPPPPSREQIATLRGKNLACCCKPGDPCHADVLLEIANR